MKVRIALLLVSLMVSVTSLASEPEYYLGVQGVACPYCAFGVEKQLNKVQGVKSVIVDIGESRVRVTMDESAVLNEQQARQAVEDAGFSLESFSQTEEHRSTDNAQ